jgi:hypothetical protein
MRLQISDIGCGVVEKIFQVVSLLREVREIAFNRMVGERPSSDRLRMATLYAIEALGMQGMWVGWLTSRQWRFSAIRRGRGCSTRVRKTSEKSDHAEFTLTAPECSRLESAMDNREAPGRT